MAPRSSVDPWTFSAFPAGRQLRIPGDRGHRGCILQPQFLPNNAIIGFAKPEEENYARKSHSQISQKVSNTSLSNTALRSVRRKAIRNEREKNRLRTITKAMDVVQGTVWKEPVLSSEERRPRLAVLQRSAAYISLLASVVDETVSKELSAEVKRFVSESTDMGIAARAERLRQLLTKREEEEEAKTTPPRSQSLATEKPVALDDQVDCFQSRGWFFAV